MSIIHPLALIHNNTISIVIGSVLDWSYNFYWSSLVLRSAW
mgnify:CR=1 FL=1